MSIEDDAKMFEMEQDAAQFGNQTIGDIPAGQSQLPPESASNLSDGSSGYQMENAKWKKIPSFMKKLESMGTSLAQGSLEWGQSLMNNAPIPKEMKPFGDNIDAIKQLDDKNKADDAEYSGLGGYQAAGKLLPDLAAFAAVDKGRSLLSKPIEAAGKYLAGATIPGTELGVMGVNAAGKALEKIGAGPAAIGKASPFFTKTAAEYGAAGARDLATFSAVEGLRYNPENLEAGFNSDKALEMLENPALALGASAIGHKVGKYLDNSRSLGKAKETYSPYATAYQLKDQGPTRTLEAKALGVLPNLFGFGKLVDQIHSISADTRDFVGKMLGSPEIRNGVDAGEKAGRYVQAALKRTKRTEDQAWKAVPKDAQIVNKSGLKQDVLAAQEILKDSEITLAGKTSKYLDKNTPETPTTSLILPPSTKKDYLNELLNKDNFTVADAKEIQSLISSAANSARHMKGGGDTARRMANDLQAVKENVLNKIDESLDENGQIAFKKARQISKQNFELMGLAPSMSKAVHNGVVAQQIADKLISESTSGKAVAPVMDKMSEQGRNMVAKYKLLKSLDSHTNPDGSVNMQGFMKQTGDLSRTNKVMSPGTYGAYQGFLKYLEGVDEAASTGWWTQATVAGTVAAGAIAKGGVSKTLGTAVAASYPVLGMIANHSPLKSLLHALTRKLPDSTYNAVAKNIEKYLTRGGFYITDGVMKKRDE